MDERAEAPEQIGNYRITGELGRGGMGVVFRGEHLSLGRPAAIKVLPPQLAGREEFVARFLREARAAARLDHPNLVRVYDAGKTNGSYYIAMELVPGHTLAQELSQKGPLPVHRALEVARAVALALTEAARHDIIHRNVKPANILIRDDGRRPASNSWPHPAAMDALSPGLAQRGRTRWDWTTPFPRPPAPPVGSRKRARPLPRSQ